MTEKKVKAVRPRLEELMAQDRDLLKALVKEALDQILQAEMTEFLGAAPGERNGTRAGYRAGYYERGLVTRVGKIELRVPRDRSGEFSTALFERFQRSEKALVSALVEMYVQGVSTRKVKAITEELCGHSFAASTISAVNKGLDEGLTKFAQRRLTEPYPYLILDARYEKVREDGIIQSQAVLIAIGINWEGQRQVLGVDLANRESQSSWRDFLLGLKQRGLIGVEVAVSDDHAGLRKAIAEVLPEAAWGCYLPIHAAMFRGSLVSQCRFDETLSLSEDWDFWLQAAAVPDFLVVPQETAIYRCTSGRSGMDAPAGDPRGEDFLRNRARVTEKWRAEGERLISEMDNDFADAVAFFESGNQAAALAAADSILRRYPYHVGSLMLAGTVHALRGGFEDATRHFHRAVVEFPEDGSAHFNLSQALGRLDRGEAAQFHHHRAMELGHSPGGVRGTRPK